MVLSLINQSKLLVFSLLTGILTGVLFDIYRVIRGFEKPNRIVTFIEDLLFWILASLIVFIFLMYTNEAYINFNVCVYIIIGVLFYIKVLSKIFMKTEVKIMIFNAKIIRITTCRILYPIQLILYKIKNKKKSKK